MEIESTLTRKTYVKLMLALTLRSSTFYFIAAITLVFLVLQFQYESFLNYVTAILVVIILYYAIWLLYQCFSPNNTKHFFVNRHFIFSDENILVKFPMLMLEQVIKWEAFKEWTKADGCYLLRFTNGNMAIIPRSDIPSSEIPSFENLLRQKIDKIVMTRLTEGN